MNLNAKTPDLPEETSAIEVSYPSDGVALINIASEPLGVLRHGVKRALITVLDELEADNSVRCALLTGMGKSFSVGSDIRDFSPQTSWLLENDYWESTLNQRIEDARFPVIAVCNGYTLGGGAVLAAACDFRLASETATFGFPEVSVGAFASGSGTQRIPRLVGRGRALELLLTGRVINAEEALRIGLVELVFPKENLMEEALIIAQKIASFPAAATASTKACVNRGLREGMDAGLALESILRVKTGGSTDAIEGQNAFLEKRPPEFNKG
jgi:enoyl-CoA hydratase/carnithine racemase